MLSTMTLTKLYLRTWCADGFKPLYSHPLYIFFLNSSFANIGLDRLKYRSGLIHIGLDWLILIRMG